MSIDPGVTSESAPDSAPEHAFVPRAGSFARAQPLLPTWLLVLLWVVMAGVLGVAAGVDATVTTMLVLALGVLAVLLGRVEITVFVVVAAACFEDYLAHLSPSTTKVLAVVLVGAWALSRARDGALPGRRSAILWPILGLTLVLLLSSLVNGAGPGTSGSLGRWFGFVAVALVLADCLRARLSVERVAGVYVAACAAAATCGIVGYALKTSPRVGGPIGDPNDFGFFLLAALPLSVALRRSTTRTWPWDLASMLIFLAMVGTLSRGALVGLLVVLVFAGVTRQLSVNALVGVVGLLLTLVGVAVGVFPSQVHQSLTEKSAVADQNVSERLFLWHSAEDMAMSNPVLGKGPGSFAQSHDSYTDGRLPLNVNHLLDVAHNTYLEVIAELGILGIVAFLALLFTGFWGAWVCWRRDRSPVAAGVTCALVGVVVAGFFLSEEFYLPFWLLSVLGAALAVRPPRRVEPVRVD